MQSSRCALAALVAPTLLAAACGDNGSTPDGPVPPPVDAPADAPAPSFDKLSGTGLCLDAGCAQISPEVHEYLPRFALWDDEATKRRWIYLPPGTKIDTSDMDHWVFPVGTKVWKEFTRDGVRVETRLIMRRVPDATSPLEWMYATYQWNAAQDDTMAVTSGVQNANGTQHDIPSRTDCRTCHERLQPTRILGFDAIQLDYANPTGLDLDELIAMNLLTAPPAGASPHFPLPGTQVDQAALGYFHGNCAHCHNPSSDLQGKTPLDLRLRATTLSSVTEARAYATAVNVNASIPYTEGATTYTKLIIPNDPANSAVIGRMNSQIPLRFMPNVAVEDVDPAGQAALTAWINSL